MRAIPFALLDRPLARISAVNAVLPASAAISTCLNERASGSISQERSVTAGMRKTATCAPEARAISAASLILPRYGDDDRAAVLGRVADDGHDHRGDEEVAQVRLLGERLESPHEDLRHERRDHRRAAQNEEGGGERPRRHVGGLV